MEKEMTAAEKIAAAVGYAGQFPQGEYDLADALLFAIDYGAPEHVQLFWAEELRRAEEANAEIELQEQEGGS